MGETDLPNTPFQTLLSRFGNDAASAEEMQAGVDAVIRQGPQIIMYDSSQPDVVFSDELEAAMALDVKLDEALGGSEGEARKFAAAAFRILTAFGDEEAVRCDMLCLAQGATETVTRIRQQLAGRIPQEGFEVFVARRPWPVTLIQRVLTLSEEDLASLADALETGDYNKARRILRLLS